MVPLINVVFLLIVFFLLAGSIEAPDPLAVAPPTTRHDAPDTAEGPLLLVAADGRLALDGALITEPELAPRLAALGVLPAGESSGAAPAARLRLKADAGLPAARLRALLLRLHGLGVQRLGLIAERQR